MKKLVIQEVENVRHREEEYERLSVEKVETGRDRYQEGTEETGYTGSWDWKEGYMSLSVQEGETGRDRQIIGRILGDCSLLTMVIQEVETVRHREEGYKRLSVQEVETGRDR